VALAGTTTGPGPEYLLVSFLIPKAAACEGTLTCYPRGFPPSKQRSPRGPKK
jgi:hypothetical protein